MTTSTLPTASLWPRNSTSSVWPTETTEGDRHFSSVSFFFCDNRVFTFVQGNSCSFLLLWPTEVWLLDLFCLRIKPIGVFCHTVSGLLAITPESRNLKSSALGFVTMAAKGTTKRPIWAECLPLSTVRKVKLLSLRGKTPEIWAKGTNYVGRGDKLKMTVSEKEHEVQSAAQFMTASEHTACTIWMSLNFQMPTAERVSSCTGCEGMSPSTQTWRLFPRASLLTSGTTTGFRTTSSPGGHRGIR